MANQYKNKVVYYGETLMDISEDTVTADKLLAGYTAHDASGAPIVGSYTPSGASVIVVEDETDEHGGTWGSERSNAMPKVTQLASDRARIHTLEVCFQMLALKS